MLRLLPLWQGQRVVVSNSVYYRTACQDATPRTWDAQEATECEASPAQYPGPRCCASHGCLHCHSCSGSHHCSDDACHDCDGDAACRDAACARQTCHVAAALDRSHRRAHAHCRRCAARGIARRQGVVASGSRHAWTRWADVVAGVTCEGGLACMGVRASATSHSTTSSPTHTLTHPCKRNVRDTGVAVFIRCTPLGGWRC